jgi:Ankyrin repeats (3 copies)/Ankyrin repeat
MVGMELKKRGQSRGIITLRIAIKSDPMPVYYGLEDKDKSSMSATEAFVRVLSASVPNRPNRILEFLESSRGESVNLNTAVALGGRVAKVAADRRGLSPLMFALLIADKKKRREVIKKMLDMGASPHYRVEGTGNARADQLTPVYYAAMGGLLRSALLLLHYCTPPFGSIDHPAHSLLDGNTPLMATIMWNREATMRGLLRNGADANLSNDTGVTPLILAAHKGRSLSVIRTLVRAGADVNIASSQGSAALFEYARHGDAECVEYLLRKGAKQTVHSSGLTPLLAALAHRNFAIVPTLIDSAARDGVLDVFALHQNSHKTVSKFNALALAALNTRKSLVRHLIAAGANHKLPVVLCDQPITIHDLLDRFGFGEFI